LAPSRTNGRAFFPCCLDCVLVVLVLLASFIVLELLFREKAFVSSEEAAADPSPVGPGGSLLVVMVVLSYYLLSIV